MTIKDKQTTSCSSPIEPVVSLVYCYECRRKHAFIPVDDGAHTAIVRKCECCGKRRSILGDRHWKPEYPTGMICSKTLIK